MTSDRTPASLEGLVARVEQEQTLWVRAAICRQPNEEFQVRLLEIIAGRPSERWKLERWNYPDAIFTATTVPGGVVAEWLRTKQATFDGCLPISVTFADSLRWERRDSLAQGQYEVVSWPTYETSLANLSNVEPPGQMVSDATAPSFTSFFNAAAAFFVLGARPSGGLLSTSAVFRWQDTTARINRVCIGTDELAVDVEVSGPDPVILELAGDQPGEQRQVSTGGQDLTRVTVTFALSDGLPAGAWVLVRRGSEWLDRRFLTWPWARGPEPGVELDLPARTRIEALLSNRENQTTEFKRQVPGDQDSKAPVMKTVCAFANGEGGSVLFGIDDDYRIVGLPEQTVGSQIDQLSATIDSWVEPTPLYRFDVLETESPGVVILELVVSEGTRLYGSSKPNEPRRVYVRHHARSVPARISEIEAIVQARNIATPARRLL